MTFTTFLVDAILFDMDGTLIDSTPGVLEAWKTIVQDYNLKEDYLELAHRMHGRPLFETLPEVSGITDPERLKKEIIRIEEVVVNKGPKSLPGAAEILKALPPHCWTIVTSATNLTATRSLPKSGLPLPQAGIVSADNPDVKRGKPAPDPYLVGAKTVLADPTKCLVIEDAISGLKSGKSAGAKVVAVCTTSPRDILEASDAHPDFIITDLTRITVKQNDTGIEVTVDESY